MNATSRIAGSMTLAARLRAQLGSRPPRFCLLVIESSAPIARKCGEVVVPCLMRSSGSRREVARSVVGSVADAFVDPGDHRAHELPEGCDAILPVLLDRHRPVDELRLECPVDELDQLRLGRWVRRGAGRCDRCAPTGSASVHRLRPAPIESCSHTSRRRRSSRPHPPRRRRRCSRCPARCRCRCVRSPSPSRCCARRLRSGDCSARPERRPCPPQLPARWCTRPCPRRPPGRRPARCGAGGCVPRAARCPTPAAGSSPPSATSTTGGRRRSRPGGRRCRVPRHARGYERDPRWV